MFDEMNNVATVVNKGILNWLVHSQLYQSVLSCTYVVLNSTSCLLTMCVELKQHIVNKKNQSMNNIFGTIVFL